MELNKYGKLAKKYLEEYKPFKFQNLIMDGSIMNYLYDFQNHLNSYANWVEFELKKKYPMTSDRNSFLEQVQYINMIQEMVDEFVKEEIKLV